MRTAPAKFRRANSVDKETIQRISPDAYIPEYMAVLGTIPKPPTEDYEPRIEKGRYGFWKVEVEPTGIAVLEERADYLLVYSKGVKLDAQRNGHGTSLLEFADQRAIGLGLREVRLYTNKRMEGNLRLYRRCGFVEIGKKTASKQARAGARRYGSEPASSTSLLPLRAPQRCLLRGPAASQSSRRISSRYAGPAARKSSFLGGKIEKEAIEKVAETVQKKAEGVQQQTEQGAEEKKDVLAGNNAVNYFITTAGHSSFEAENRHPASDDHERTAIDDLARGGAAAVWRDDVTWRKPVRCRT